MRKDKIYEIVSEYGNRITTIGIVIFVIFMIITVKTYINYSAIIDEIDRVQNDIESVNEEIAYSENFYKAYLDSEYAPYFLAHKNNVLFYNEMIIRFTNPYENTNTEDESTNTTTSELGSGVDISNPEKARQHFIKSKINKE